MTKDKFKEIMMQSGFEYAVQILGDEVDNIHLEDDLKEYAKYLIDNDNLYLAIHVLKGINNNPAYLYDYDITMGTLENVTPITEIEDIEQYLE